MSPATGINRRIPITLTDALIRRFWSRVNIGRKSECWPWEAAMRNGYGAIKHEGRVISAHRLAYVIEHGEPADGLIVGHKCDNRACCNPNHLEAITPGQNNRDARGRSTFHMTRGADHPDAVLSEGDVREIRKRYAAGESLTRIAKDYPLGRSSVVKAATGKTWRHVV